MNTFCTVVTASHISFAKVVYESVQRFIPKIVFNVLVVDATKKQKEEFEAKNFIITLPEDIESPVANTIKNKYYGSQMDFYRWSMKSVFISYLLDEKFEKVVYVDSDVFFYEDPGFLLERLNHSNILLSPHWRNSNLDIDPEDFVRNHTHGLFNGGFVAVNSDSQAALRWWANSCAHTCKISGKKGFYVDQSYLNLFPVLFDKVEIIQHRGCNVANWNRRECRRTLNGSKVLVNDKYPIVFIHMTKDTIEGVLNGQDDLLRPHLTEYEAAIKSVDSKFSVVGNRSRSRKFFNLMWLSQYWRF